jgi:hypothetical protein
MAEETNNIFIPKKIKVGYNERKETYTGKLGYIIYQDNKGVWRKEKSWTSWKDDKIPADEFDNTPQDGLCLNKDVKRYNWSHFGSNRSYIRVYDPRGFEFEITPENLIGILTETDCLKRGLDGKFVYAWEGTNLILLPCGSETYQKAQEHTDRQDKKVLTKDLKPGYAYITKKGEEVIYLGRFDWHEYKYEYKNGRQEYVKEQTKSHIFTHTVKPEYSLKSFFPKKDVSFLASVTSGSEVVEYPILLEEFNATTNASPIVSFETKPNTTKKCTTFIENTTDQDKYINQNFPLIHMKGDEIIFGYIQIYGPKREIWKPTRRETFTYQESGRFNTTTMKWLSSYSGWSTKNNCLTMEEVHKLEDSSVNVFGITSNGSKIVIDGYNSILK